MGDTVMKEGFSQRTIPPESQQVCVCVCARLCVCVCRENYELGTKRRWGLEDL